MQTLKTAVVVVLLLVVFYGVYEVLNRPPAEPPREVAAMDEQEIVPPAISFGDASAPGSTEPLVSIPSAGPSSDTMGASTAPATSQFPAMPVDTAASPNANTTPPTNIPSGGLDVGTLPPPLPGNAVAAPAPADPAPERHTAATAPMATRTPGPTNIAATSDPNQPLVQSNPYVHQNTLGTPPGGNGTAANDKSVGRQAYQHAVRSARTAIEKGHYHDALFTLSAFYKSQDLTPEEQTELLDMLDPLAGKVIYSREHLVEPAYKVRRNETLMDISQHYHVPWQLLQKINGIENPRVLLPGSELKVVSGPFRAEVDLQARELTVFLGQLYAGRFPISIGADPAPVDGEYEVRDKREDRPYFTTDGRQIPAGSPNNPFGRVWLDLGKEICIHGSPATGSDAQHGCISLSPRDADDIYGILSLGSKIRILR